MADKKLLYYTEGDYAYMIDSPSDSTTYICYDDAEQCIIKRVTKTGTVTRIEFSYGRWEDRASLNYFPICRPIDMSLL